MSEIEHKGALEELNKSYNSYKKGEYTFGKFGTEDDLVQARLFNFKKKDNRGNRANLSSAISI